VITLLGRKPPASLARLGASDCRSRRPADGDELENAAQLERPADQQAGAQTEDDRRPGRQQPLDDRRRARGPVADAEEDVPASAGASGRAAPMEPRAVGARPHRMIEMARYHEGTKHSPASVRSSLHYLDWANKPLAFKIYTGLDGAPTPDDIGRLCRLSNGVLRWRRYPGDETYGFRAAPCTGALYHVELYLAVPERPDLAAGLYHYGAHDHRLRQLREGDVRGAVAEAAGSFEGLAEAPLVLILTSTFWRNSWKYQARAYRHTYWDSGAVLANLLALAADMRLKAAAVMGFADAAINRLLGVDGQREAAVALVGLGDGAPVGPARELSELHQVTMPLSVRQIRYREIEEAHATSSLASGAEAATWRAVSAGAPPAVPPTLLEDPEGVIRARRSARRFGPGPIPRGDLEALLEAAEQRVPGDCFSPGLVAPFVIVNDVAGLEPGIYGPGLQLIRGGDFRLEAGGLALGQALGAEAAANIYFLADLEEILGRLGGRGYRVSQMAGGIAGTRVELKAVALGLGSTGLTFFDDDVTEFFEPAASGRQVMYLVAVGRRSG
jgi:SagB-type dehydrogenase family enzyme